MKFKLCLLGCQTLTIELPHHGCIFHYVGACKRKKIVLKKKSNYEKKKKQVMHFSIFFNYIFNVGFLLCNYSIEITKKSVQHPSEKGYNFFLYIFF